MRSAGGMLVDVVEVEVQIAFELAELVRLRQSGKGVFAGDLRQRDRAVDEPRDAFVGEVGGRGARRVLSDKDAQAHGARARLLQRLDLPQPHQRRELIAFIDDGLGVGGAGFEGLREHIRSKLFQIGRDSRC